MIPTTSDIRIRGLRPLIPPAILLEDDPITHDLAEFVTRSQEDIGRIFRGEDDRLVVVVGPCSIHDTEAALDYATRLKKIADPTAPELLIVMRTYFEKPRTVVGSKGSSTTRAWIIPYASITACASPADYSSICCASHCPRARNFSMRSPRNSSPTSFAGGYRRTHHRKPDPPRAGLWAFDAGWFQEWHGRRHSNRSGRREVRPLWPLVPFRDQARSRSNI